MDFIRYTEPGILSFPYTNKSYCLRSYANIHLLDLFLSKCSKLTLSGYLTKSDLVAKGMFLSSINLTEDTQFIIRSSVELY